MNGETGGPATRVSDPGVAALTSHQPGHLGRAAIGAAALTCFYLALPAIRPGGMGPGGTRLS